MDCDIPLPLLDCVPAIVSIGFQITQNGENVFDEGILSVEDVTTFGPDAEGSQLEIQTGFDGIEGSLLFVRNLNWSEGSYSFSLNFGSAASNQVNFSISLSPPSPCCGSYPILQEITIDNAPPTFVHNSGFYAIELAQ